MPGIDLLAAELAAAGFAVAELAAVTSGSLSVAAVAALRGGGKVFAKADAEADVYEELARPFDGWQDQGQLLRIWDLFSTIAHGSDTWGAAEIVRKLIAPFRPGRGRLLWVCSS